jgi:hypothetical protein
VLTNSADDVDERDSAGSPGGLVAHNAAITIASTTSVAVCKSIESGRSVIIADLLSLLRV